MYLKLTNDIVVRLLGLPDEETFMDMLRRPVLMEVVVAKPTPIATLHRVYGGMYDAKLLLETCAEKDIPLLDALIAGYGYKPDWRLRILMLPRILSTLRVDGIPIYVCQFTTPNTGKSFFAIKNRTALNWAYTAEVPSLAFLVYDAKSGFPGVVVYRDGIAFDGVDKWSDAPFRLSRDYELLLTGMEEGVWARGVSTPVGEVHRYLNMIFFGNLPYIPSTRHDREIVEGYLSSLWNSKVFIDRIAVCHVYTERITLSDYITGMYLPDGLLQRVVEEVSRLASRQPRYSSSLQGRYKLHADRVYRALSVLMPSDVDKIDVDTMVEHGFTYMLEVMQGG